MEISGEDLYREHLRREKKDFDAAFPYEFMDPELSQPWEMVAKAINSLKMNDPMRNLRAIRPGNALP